MRFPVICVPNPSRFDNFLVGLAALADGLIRILSLGFLAGRFQLEVAGWRIRREFARRKKLAASATPTPTGVDQYGK